MISSQRNYELCNIWSKWISYPGKYFYRDTGKYINLIHFVFKYLLIDMLNSYWNKIISFEVCNETFVRVSDMVLEYDTCLQKSKQYKVYLNLYSLVESNFSSYIFCWYPIWNNVSYIYSSKFKMNCNYDF